MTADWPAFVLPGARSQYVFAKWQAIKKPPEGGFHFLSSNYLEAASAAGAAAGASEAAGAAGAAAGSAGAAAGAGAGAGASSFLPQADRAAAAAITAISTRDLFICRYLLIKTISGNC
jgi:hypothetical protein